VNDQVANVVMAQLLHLKSEDPEQDINLYINSPGGSVYAGMAIYGTMRFIKCDVATALAMVASMGAFLLAAGTKGKRSELANTRILLRQLSIGGLGGQVSDVEIHARELMRCKKRTNELLAEMTGQPIERSSAIPIATTCSAQVRRSSTAW
jgi:ATP-dependent Clp protease protease subunit